MSFAQRVYEAIRTIPEGKVSTYKLVAHALGSRAYQAVGNALRSNPDAPRTPCHRVIASDRSLGGFRGCTEGEELACKKRMLEEEGVVVVDGRVPEEFVVSPTLST